MSFQVFLVPSIMPDIQQAHNKCLLQPLIFVPNLFLGCCKEYRETKSGIELTRSP